jgi:hypothetical protein
MLMPAAVLVMVVLAAIAMDLSLVHLGRRELVAAAEAAANDATTYGIDEPAYRAGAGVRLDPMRVQRSVHQTLAARGLVERLEQAPRVEIVGNGVRVSLAMQVRYVFAKALPGVDHTVVVTASGAAMPVER